VWRYFRITYGTDCSRAVDHWFKSNQNSTVREAKGGTPWSECAAYGRGKVNVNGFELADHSNMSTATECVVKHG
jgi:hypothetical protein